MNNNIQRINKGLAEFCKSCIETASQDPSAMKEILRGGGSNGGLLARLLMPRPIEKLRISQNALKVCLEHNVLPYDLFILPREQLVKKYGCFFKSNAKTVQERIKKGQFVTADHNVPNKELIQQMIELCLTKPKATVNDYAKILSNQSYDVITIEENDQLDQAGFKATGSKEQRDALTSPKITFTDLWLTPKDVIEKFFDLTHLNKNECLDPCACDGRWLGQEGTSIDILPMQKDVKQQDFLTLTKQELPKNVKYIVGNLPFSLLDEFVNHALELVNECYFLVSGDTIFQHFPNNIEHLYIFNGLEGNQKDYRSRCEFDVPFLIKSALWCCIVHITKQQQSPGIVEHNLPNEVKRDGNHIMLGKNTFINCEKPVVTDERVSMIPVKSEINGQGGKSIEIDGKKLDLRNFSNIF